MPGRKQLLEIALRLTDGVPIDWAAYESDLSSPEDRQLLLRLRDLERLASVDLIGQPSTPLAHDSIRGGADETADRPVRWGHLQIREKIGRGAYGDVYRAWDPRLGREVALKLLRARETDTTGSYLIREGHLLSRVRHPNIVTVYGAERIDGRTGVWMELVAGRTLRDEVEARGSLSAREIAIIGLQLCDALGAVHAAGLLHCDIKAHNVMRSADGRLVMTDFGAGHDVGAAEGIEPAGTLVYAAPEILEGARPTRQSDIYSLGVLLWYLATGDYPLHGTTVDEMRRLHRAGHTPKLERADLDPALVAAIGRALHRAPKARFETAAAMKTAVELAATQRKSAASMVVMTVLFAATAVLAATVLAPASNGASALTPEPLVLVTSFDNLTHEPSLSGAVEHALERELSNAPDVDPAPRSRVQEALSLMKLPAETRVDRRVGREVCVRDGGIDLLLAGRVEKLGGVYVVSTQLIDRLDDSIRRTISDRASHQSELLDLLDRHAKRVRRALTPLTAAASGGTVPRDQGSGSTKSLRAFQLHQQSYELGRRGLWSAALEVARQTVVEDPEFASGWIWLAWTHRNTKPSSGDVPPEVRSAAERAMQLNRGLMDWEQHWITGSYHFLLRNREAAIPSLRALLELRPHHQFAMTYLLTAMDVTTGRGELTPLLRRVADARPDDVHANYRAASAIVEFTKNLAAAEPYVKRTAALVHQLEPQAGNTVRAWLALLPAYASWRAGDARAAADLMESAATQLQTPQSRLSSAAIFALGNFAITLGQLERSATFFALASDTERRRRWELGLLAAGGDEAALRATLRDVGRIEARPTLLLAAGMTEEARRMTASQVARQPLQAVLLAMARGELALIDGHFEQARVQLEPAVDALSSRPNLAEYYRGCRLLAAALQRLGRDAEALRKLESCAANQAPFLLSGWFNATHWMKTRLLVATEYRARGRVDDARRIEQDLRRLLVVADADFPLLQELGTRQ